LKRLTTQEISQILRKFPQNRLNDIDFGKLTYQDLVEIHYMNAFGKELLKEIKTESKKYKLLSPKGELLEFSTAKEVSKFFGKRAKNYWSVYAKKAGYEILEARVKI
jgi:hypothetical protein